MTDQPTDENDDGPFAIDLGAARLARVENYLVGGQAHFAIDRAAAESIGDLSRGGLDGLRVLISAVKAFTARAVHVAIGELGMRQILHIGMSTPTTGMVHEVAWKIAPDARIVYASYDPTTLAHVHTLPSDAEGVVAHVHSAFDDTRTILREAAVTLALDQPVAVVLPTTLNLIADDATAQRIVDDLRAAMTPGSYLIFAHTSLDLAPEGTAKVLERFNEMLDERYVVRTEAQIAGLLTGFDLIEPGLVPVGQWRPDGDPPAPDGTRAAPIYGAIGRRPAD